jgi:hypothetical protein
MKHIVLVSIVSVFVALAACDNHDTVVGPVLVPDVADLHTEFLRRVFERSNTYDPNQVSSADKIEIAYRVAKEICEEYGVDALTRGEVVAAMNRGYEMAQQDPVELVRQALPGDQYEWWDRFAGKATVEDARAIYEETCESYGAPQPGTMLKDLVDISLGSAEFWVEKRGEVEPSFANPGVRPIENGWKRRFLKFSVLVTVDALAGAAAGAGTPADPITRGVVGSIVGGLASYAVDDLLFGHGP